MLVMLSLSTRGRTVHCIRARFGIHHVFMIAALFHMVSGSFLNRPVWTSSM